MAQKLIKRRMSPKRIWQAVLAVILLGGIHLFLSGPETAIARQWVETMLGRFR